MRSVDRPPNSPFMWRYTSASAEGKGQVTPSRSHLFFVVKNARAKIPAASLPTDVEKRQYCVSESGKMKECDQMIQVIISSNIKL